MRDKNFRDIWISCARGLREERKISILQYVAAMALSRNPEAMDLAKESLLAEAVSQGRLLEGQEVDWEGLKDLLLAILPIIIDALLKLLPLFLQQRMT